MTKAFAGVQVWTGLVEGCEAFWVSPFWGENWVEVDGKKGPVQALWEGAQEFLGAQSKMRVRGLGAWRNHLSTAVNLGGRQGGGGGRGRGRKD